MNKQFTLKIETENSASTLNRIHNVFTRRQLKVNALMAIDIQATKHICYVYTFESDEIILAKVVGQLKKIIEVFTVSVCPDASTITESIHQLTHDVGAIPTRHSVLLCQ